MFSLVLAIAPTIAIMVFIYNKDRYDKEPKLLLLKLFFFGILTIIPTVLFERMFIFDIENVMNSSLLSIFLHSLIGIALVEEGFKYVALRLGTRKCKYFNQMYDSIVYSVSVSLGFATVENIMYVLSYGGKAGIMRSLTAVPGHAIFGITMGYYLGMATFTFVKHKKKIYMTMSLLMPILLHGIYDFLLLSQHVLLLLAFYPFMVYLYIIGIKRANELCKIDNYNRRLENQKRFHEENNNQQDFSFGRVDPYHYHDFNTRPYTNYRKVDYNYLKNPNQNNYEIKK